MIVAAHQPDLLPYSGFWHKMARADVFELGIYYQFVDKGYQRRVKMRDRWAGVPILGNPSRSPIRDVCIAADAGPRLADIIVGRYSGARYYKQRGIALVDYVREQRTDHLWEFNLALIIYVRDLLGITTPVSIGSPLVGTKSDAVVHGLQQYGGAVTEHLSGPGARSYMGEGSEFTAAGIKLTFSHHDAITGDSIVSVLMDHDDPLGVVMKQHASDERAA